jgi:acyl transferase domain-containing protein
MYWLQNLLNPVLFKEAVEYAAEVHGPFSGALEVGPHAALKTPVVQTVKSHTTENLGYHGTLTRDSHDVNALTKGVAFLWSTPKTPLIDITKFWRACSGLGSRPPHMLKDLPAYPWDHSISYWRESRISREFRLRDEPFHPLLGVRVSSFNDEFQWRNILHIEDIPWVKGHRVQGEVLFPASAYCSMAVDASTVLTRGRTITLVEIENVYFEAPLALGADQEGTELSFILRKRNPESLGYTASGEVQVEAEFSCVAGKAGSSHPLRRMVSGCLRIHFGTPSANVLPYVPADYSDLRAAPIADMYHQLTTISLGYTGMFQGLDSAYRRFHHAKVTTKRPRSAFCIHPAALDCYFQSVFVAYAAPGDG